MGDGVCVFLQQDYTVDEFLFYVIIMIRPKYFRGNIKAVLLGVPNFGELLLWVIGAGGTRCCYETAGLVLLCMLFCTCAHLQKSLLRIGYRS